MLFSLGPPWKRTGYVALALVFICVTSAASYFITMKSSKSLHHFSYQTWSENSLSKLQRSKLLQRGSGDDDDDVRCCCSTLDDSHLPRNNGRRSIAADAVAGLNCPLHRDLDGGGGGGGQTQREETTGGGGRCSRSRKKRFFSKFVQGSFTTFSDGGGGGNGSAATANSFSTSTVGDGGANTVGGEGDDDNRALFVRSHSCEKGTSSSNGVKRGAARRRHRAMVQEWVRDKIGNNLVVSRVVQQHQARTAGGRDEDGDQDRGRARRKRRGELLHPGGDPEDDDEQEEEEDGPADIGGDSSSMSDTLSFSSSHQSYNVGSEIMLQSAAECESLRGGRMNNGFSSSAAVGDLTRRMRVLRARSVERISKKSHVIREKIQQGIVRASATADTASSSFPRSATAATATASRVESAPRAGGHILPTPLPQRNAMSSSNGSLSRQPHRREGRMGGSPCSTSAEAATIVLCRGRALVDCTPSPYDRDALKFRRGDLIDIVAMNPNGLWRGKNVTDAANGHADAVVGTFKFINVEIIPSVEEEESGHNSATGEGGIKQDGGGGVDASRRVCSRQNKEGEKHLGEEDQQLRSIEAFLRRHQLQCYLSVFVLNGYEDVDSLSAVRPGDLDYLGITDEQHRNRILGLAAERQQQQERSPPPFPGPE